MLQLQIAQQNTQLPDRDNNVSPHHNTVHFQILVRLCRTVENPHLFENGALAALSRTEEDHLDLFGLEPFFFVKVYVDEFMVVVFGGL